MKIKNTKYICPPYRFHAENRDLLESLGLDGKVPLRQARINAGLDVPEMKVAA